MGQDIRPENKNSDRDTVARLKELLFDDEAATLKGLSQRIDQVHDRAGTDDQLRTSVARVLDGALVEAEKSRHEQMSRAMAPMVVKTVKAEFMNSQDELVEALYPITGRMVKTYVATAMKDLANEINRKLENNSFMLRIRSLTTGRPVSELAISDSQRLAIDEILLIRRGSGELLERWPDTRGLSNRDMHLSGVLSAINDFAAQTLQEDGGNIRNFAVDNYSMFLRSSPKYLLAAKCTGTSASGIQYIIDDEFLGLLERIQANQPGDALEHNADTNLLSETKERLDERIKARFDEITTPLPFRPLKVLAVLLLLGLLAGLGWWTYTNYEASRTHQAATRIIAATPGMKPDYIDLKVGYRGRSIDLSGLSPSTAITGLVIKELETKLEGVAVRNRLFSMPTVSNSAELEIARLRKELATREFAATAASLQHSLQRTSLRLAATIPAFEQIERHQDASAGKAAARQAKARIEQSERELKSYMGAIEAAPHEPGALQDMAKPLAALADRLAATRSVLTGLLEPGTSVPPPPAPGPATTTLAGSANRTAAEADQIAGLAVALSVPRSIPETPRQHLLAWMQNNALFFSNEDQFRSPTTAAAKLDRLASLIKADDGIIRIVGYTDERGSQSRNDPIAQRRAERVREELEQRGIPSARLLTMGRATGPDLSPDTGPDSPNRRVQFELGYIGERRPDQ